jgi:hypothetical protein
MIQWVTKRSGNKKIRYAFPAGLKKINFCKIARWK